MLTSIEYDDDEPEEHCHDCPAVVTTEELAVYVLLDDGTLAPLCADCTARRKRAAQTRMNGGWRNGTKQS